MRVCATVTTDCSGRISYRLRCFSVCFTGLLDEFVTTNRYDHSCYCFHCFSAKFGNFLDVCSNVFQECHYY